MADLALSSTDLKVRTVLHEAWCDSLVGKKPFRFAYFYDVKCSSSLGSGLKLILTNQFRAGESN